MGIMNRDGALFMATGVDNSGFRRDLNEAQNLIGGLESYAKKAGIGIGSFLGVQGLKAFGNEIINVRGEIESFEKSFNVLLGSESKSAAMLSSMKGITLKSNFSITDLSGAAQTLLGFGVEAEKVIPTIEQLGNISMGNTDRFKSLALAFAQMSATGKLMGQDLLQMINAGFNPLQIIAEKTGKTMIQVKQQMSDGAISSEMVADAFRSAATEGGKFFGMMESQADAIKGEQAKLSGAIQDQLNDLGKSNEDIIKGGYQMATSMVKNYQIIAEALMVLIATYGAYRAAIMFDTAIQPIIIAKQYEAQAAALSKLLTGEQAHRISQMGLVQGSAEHVAAMKTEIAARAESIQSKLAEEQINLQVIRTNRVTAEQTLMLAKAKTQAAREELAAAIATAQGDVAAKQQKTLATAQESAALTRRNAILLNSQKIQLQQSMADTISQAEIAKKNTLLLSQQKIQANKAVLDARELGVKGEKLALLRAEVSSINAKLVVAQREEASAIRAIATKRAEIVATERKLVVAKAEAIAIQQNVVAKRAEIAAGTQSVTNKNIQTLTNKVNTLSEQENTAAVTHNGLIKQMVGSKILIKKLATTADTAATTANTVATTANSAAEGVSVTMKNLVTAAANRLSVALSRTNAFLASNAYLIAIAGLAALVYGIYKVSTSLTDLEKSQKRVTDATTKYDAAVASEIADLDILFGRLKQTTKGTNEYEKAKDDIMSKAESYRTGLGKEIDLLNDVAGAYKAVSAAAIQSMKDRAMADSKGEALQAYTQSWESNFSKVRKEFLTKYGKAQGTLLLDSLKDSLNNDKELSKEVKDAVSSFSKTVYSAYGTAGQSQSYQSNWVDVAIGQIQNDKKNMQTEIEDLQAIFGEGAKESTDKPTVFKTMNEQVTAARENVSKLKNELKALQSGITPSNTYADDIEKKAKALKEAEDQLSYLLTGKSAAAANKDSNAGETAAEKARKASQKALDDQLKLDNDKAKALLEARNIELENQQSLLNIQEDGFNKQQQQLDLNHQKELLAIEKRTQELIEKKQEEERKEWDIKNPNGSKTPFTPTTLSIADLPVSDQANLAASTIIASKTQEKATADLLKSLLEKYQDFNTQRIALEKKHNEDVAALNSQRNDDNAAKTDAAIKEAKKQLKKSLSNLNLEEFQESIEWSSIFGNLDKISTNALVEVRDKIKTYLSEIGDGISKEDLKTVSDAFVNLNNAIADRSPIGELKDAYKEYRDALDEVIEAKKELKKYEDGTPEYVAATKALSEAEKKRRESLVKMNTSINEIGEKGGQLVNSGKEIIEMLSNFGVEVNESVQTALNGVGQVMSGLEKIDLTKPFSIVTGGISVLAGFGNMIAGLLGQGGNELSQETFDRYEALMSVMDRVIAKQTELLNSMAGKEAVEASEIAVKNIEKQIEATKKLGTDYLNSGDSWKSHSHIYELRKSLRPFQQELKKLGYNLDGSASAIFDLTPDQLYSIQTEIPEAWAKIDDKTREYLQTVIDSEKELEDVKDKLNEVLTGITFDSAKDSLKSLLLDSDTTMADIANNFEDYMRDAIMNIVVDGIMSQRLKDWYENFALAMKDNVLTEAEKKDLQDEYIAIYEKAKEERDALLDIANLDLKDSSSQQASKGGYETMSQDTGTAIEGRATAIQMSILLIEGYILTLIGIYTDNNNILRSFSANFQELRNIGLDIMYSNRDIKKNTEELYEINSGIKDMSRKLDRL